MECARPAHTSFSESMKRSLTGFLHGRLLGRWAKTLEHREWSKDNQLSTSSRKERMKKFATVVGWTISEVVSLNLFGWIGAMG